MKNESKKIAAGVEAVIKLREVLVKKMKEFNEFMDQMSKTSANTQACSNVDKIVESMTKEIADILSKKSKPVELSFNEYQYKCLSK